ncbi:hypothetical protein [Azospirillum sp.]|uniref:hypothetical protein n=1 Tax=Azospirillum sp. TaxID=34012 RepID=UPI003D74BA08
MLRLRTNDETLLPDSAALVPVDPALLDRLRRAAAGNAHAPEGVVLSDVAHREVVVSAQLTVDVAWVTDVETRAGTVTLRGATLCRNVAELDAVLARDLDAETASVEAARRLAAVIGVPEHAFAEEDALPTVPSMRGPYYVHEDCRACRGGGVRGCGGCRGGKVPCPQCNGDPAVGCDACGGKGMQACPACAGTAVVACEDCAGVGRFTHIHRPRLVGRPSRSLVVPPDAPDTVQAALTAAGYERFEEVAAVQPWTVRHSGTQLLYERVGTMPVITLSCVCDGVAFAVESAGPEARVPAFLDGVLAPVLEGIEAATATDAFAIARTTRVTRAIADAILAGTALDLDAIVAEHGHCVSRTVVARAAQALQRRYDAVRIHAMRRAWQQGAAILAAVVPLVAAVDLPGFLAGATAEDPAPLTLRLLWDVGVPALTGAAVWRFAGNRLRQAMRATFGTARPATQGAWPLLVLGTMAVLHLGVMGAWRGGIATDRLAEAPVAVEESVIGAPAAPPRVLSPAERIAAAQRALARLGRYEGAIDGKMGSGTRSGLESLAALVTEAPGDPLDLAVAIASDRIAIRLRTPELLVGAGWSNATRLRLTAEDQERIAAAFQGAVAAAGAPRDWTSEDAMRSGALTVTGRVEDPAKRQRACASFTHVVTTAAGRDAGTPALACHTGGRWLLEE